MARILRRTATVALATTILAVSLGAAPAYANAESSFVTKINNARSANGKAPLRVYWDLTDDARAHSKKMADRQELFHNPNLGSVTTGWKALGENVGAGPSVNLLFDAFMNSSAHRANILGNYNYVGVGVKVDGNDVIWVTMVFMLGADDLLDPPSTTTTTQPPSTTTTTQPPSTTTTTTQAPSPTTTQPPATTTTTTQAPVEPYEIPEGELVVLTDDWVPPLLLDLIGRLGH